MVAGRKSLFYEISALSFFVILMIPTMFITSVGFKALYEYEPAPRYGWVESVSNDGFVVFEDTGAFYYDDYDELDGYHGAVRWNHGKYRMVYETKEEYQHNKNTIRERIISAVSL